MELGELKETLEGVLGVAGQIYGSYEEDQFQTTVLNKLTGIQDSLTKIGDQLSLISAHQIWDEAMDSDLQSAVDGIVKANSNLTVAMKQYGSLSKFTADTLNIDSVDTIGGWMDTINLAISGDNGEARHIKQNQLLLEAYITLISATKPEDGYISRCESAYQYWRYLVTLQMQGIMLYYTVWTMFIKASKKTAPIPDQQFTYSGANNSIIKQSAVCQGIIDAHMLANSSDLTRFGPHNVDGSQNLRDYVADGDVANFCLMPKFAPLHSVIVDFGFSFWNDWTSAHNGCRWLDLKIRSAPINNGVVDATQVQEQTIPSNIILYPDDKASAFAKEMYNILGHPVYNGDWSSNAWAALSDTVYVRYCSDPTFVDQGSAIIGVCLHVQRWVSTGPPAGAAYYVGLAVLAAPIEIFGVNYRLAKWYYPPDGTTKINDLDMHYFDLHYLGQNGNVTAPLTGVCLQQLGNRLHVQGFCAFHSKSFQM